MKNIISAKETFEVMVENADIVLLKDDVRDIVEAIEKQIPKMPVETQELIEIEWLCPTCKSNVGDCVNVSNYCSNCGQKIKF